MRALWPWMLLACAACAVACGGRVALEGDGGSEVGGGSSGGNMSAAVDDDAGGGFPACPALAPAVGAPCNVPRDQGCKYEDARCSVCGAFVCVSGGWQAVACTC